MAVPGIYDFPTQWRGDTFKNMRFKFNFVIDGFQADMWIIDNYTNKPIKQLSTQDESLIIEEDTVIVESFELDLPIGDHRYDLQLIAPTGEKSTFVTGRFSVINDITKV